MKRFLKYFIAGVFYYSGIYLLARLRNYLSGKRLTILTFHRITAAGASTPGGLPTISLSLPNFDALLKFILKHYTVISLQEYSDLVQNGKKPSANCLLLTFDDAYQEVRENALPLLKKYGLAAVLFVPTAAVENGGFFWWDAVHALLSDSASAALVRKYLEKQPQDDSARSLKKIISQPESARDQAIYDLLEELQNSGEERRQQFVDCIITMYDALGQENFPLSTALDWPGIKALHDAGIAIGSHTVHHRFLSTISDDEARIELHESKKQLENHTGSPVISFAYPGGKYTDRTVKLVEESGYICAFSAGPGLNTFDGPDYCLKRINIWDNKVAGIGGKFSPSAAAWHLFPGR